MCNISTYPGFPSHATNPCFSLASSSCFFLTLFLYLPVMSCQSLSFWYTFSSLHSSFSFLVTKFTKSTLSHAFLKLNCNSCLPLTSHSFPQSHVLSYGFSRIIRKQVLQFPLHFTHKSHDFIFLDQDFFGFFLSYFSSNFNFAPRRKNKVVNFAPWMAFLSKWGRLFLFLMVFSH